jgi:aspartate aminotransferase
LPPFSFRRLTAVGVLRGVYSTQTISGTGANHLGAAFLAKFYPFPSGKKQIYISNPTWANHPAIFKNVGIDAVMYPYYDPKTVGLDYDGFKGSLEGAEEGSVFLIHACAHNVSGVSLLCFRADRTLGGVRVDEGY